MRVVKRSALGRAVCPLIETLEGRRLLHGVLDLHVNFQPAPSVVPSGFVVDSGLAYGDRGNGWVYGWNVAHTNTTRDRGAHADQRYDTFIHTQVGGSKTWELAVANGQYQVRVVAGDPSYNDSVYKIDVEGLLTVNATPSSGNRFIEGTQIVNVTDGRLTISNAGGSLNNKIAFVEIASHHSEPTLPAVSIAATSANASESGQHGAFTVSRTGSTASALNVLYQLGGSASNGIDYEQLLGSVTIPAGASSATIQIKPIDDAIVEGNETVAATILADDAYTLAAAGPASVTIADNDAAGGFSATINFQPAGAPVPAGLLVDGGHPFGGRGNGLTYGWSSDNTASARDRNHSLAPDQRYDTLNHFHNNTWELALPNGQYNVRIVAGDPGYFDSVYKIKAELDTVIVSGTPTSGSRWIEGTALVNVSDGRLTLSGDSGSFNNKICFIEVSEAGGGMPVVHVSASAGDAAEGGATQAFFFHRSGALDQPLTVYFMTGGSASNGVDYQALASPVTFAAGAATAHLTLVPIDDAVVEGTESATLTLVPHASYAIGASASATLRILDNDQASGGFAAKINFQPGNAPLPAGYFADIGLAYQAQGNGLTYGWVGGSNAAAARDRNAAASADQRYDTLTHLNSATWELAVPNGTYSVRIVAGDAGYFDSTYHITAEGVTVVNGKPTSGMRWFDGTALVSVSDGKLTIASGAGAFNNKICFIDVTQSDAPVGNTISWTTRPSFPAGGRAEALRAVVDGKLYVFGGFGADGPMKTNHVYDPATNNWTQLPDMPTRLTHAGVAVDGKDVYVAGGYVGIGTSGWSQQFGTTEVWKFNVDTKQWTAFKALPKAVAGGGLTLLGRNLHWVSGNNNSRQDIGDHYILNLDNANAGWETSTPLPFGRSHLGVVTLGGKIYAVGGQFGNDEGLTTQKYVHVWDPVNPSVWTRLADMPTGIGHIASATIVYGNCILTLGGETAHGAATELVYAYDPATNTWAAMTNLPGKRFSGVAAELEGQLFFTTGSSQTTSWKGTVT